MKIFLFSLLLLILPPVNIAYAADTTTPPVPTQSEVEKYGVQEGKDLFNPENASKLIPFGNNKTDVSNEAKSAEFFKDSSTPYVPYGESDNLPCGSSGNVLTDLISKNFSEFIAHLFGGGIKTYQTIYSNGSNIPQPCRDNTISEFKRGTKDFKDALLPANLNPLRDTSSSVSFKEIRSDSLKEIIATASQGRCVPGALLMAISQREAGGAFGYSDEQVARFTADDWQKTATITENRESYCYNTCDNPKSGCLGLNVMGPMQFEKNTWDKLYNQIRAALVADFHVSDSYIADRCNLRDSIVAAAVKIKVDSKTTAGECAGWDEDTVKNKVAASYCGCESSSACGVNYCDNIWNLYQSYSSLTP